MPRQKREKSETGIYHVMLRGIDKRTIFFDKYDYMIFLNYIEKARDKSSCVLYGYCLMPNHIHLLLKTVEEEIGEVIKRIAVGYAQYHNKKYDRTGHLFQNRFRSKPVEDNSYFLTVLRYIHQNPIKAEIVNDISTYKYSSYLEYIKRGKKELCDTLYALKMFNDLNSFTQFMKNQDENICLNDNVRIKYSDERLKESISIIVNIDSLSKTDIKSRNEKLKEIKNKTKASNRQLSRVLGINRGILDRI